MIFKVLNQNKTEVASGREQTKAMDIAANSIKNVRQNINIESIQQLTKTHLAFTNYSETLELASV